MDDFGNEIESPERSTEKVLIDKAFWEKAFLAALPFAMSCQGWKANGEPVTKGTARIRMCSRWALEAARTQAAIFDLDQQAFPEINVEKRFKDGERVRSLRIDVQGTVMNDVAALFLGLPHFLVLWDGKESSEWVAATDIEAVSP